MSVNTHASVVNDDDDDVAGIRAMIAGIGQLLLPFARMYLGPSAAVIERDERDLAAGEQRLLMFAMHKLIVESGTLPAPGTAYAPHDGKFIVDERGQAAALDLRYLLAAARALSAWAAADPTSMATANVENAGSTNAVTTTRVAGSSRGASAALASAKVASSTRAMRNAARVAGYADRANLSTRPVRRAPRGGGCGCRGSESCADCIPRGARPGDVCGGSCGNDEPAPEDCTPWSPSCETRNRLRVCLKDILCDVLACIENYLCGDGRFDAVAMRQRRAEFYRCLYALLCKVLRCVREVLCTPPPKPHLPCPPPVDCLPCNYAVEESR